MKHCFLHFFWRRSKKGIDLKSEVIGALSFDLTYTKQKFKRTENSSELMQYDKVLQNLWTVMQNKS